MLFLYPPTRKQVQCLVLVGCPQIRVVHTYSAKLRYEMDLYFQSWGVPKESPEDMSDFKEWGSLSIGWFAVWVYWWIPGVLTVRPNGINSGQNDNDTSNQLIAVNPLVTISLSDRPGHFFSIRFLTQFASDLTTVSQTRFFSFFLFSNTFWTLNVSDHTTVSQTRFKKPRSVRLWYGHWHPGIKCQKKTGLTDCGMVTGVC